ncbi:hypothetical protein [Rufibacter sp. LB8]|uniref:hypothetical protein n=1 Tax=Rufibacter sp. LB8 TaxID=2777781 RepID=UPI00178C348F|nr:hypothetical protein [Rufibacter sp. LB8]
MVRFLLVVSLLSILFWGSSQAQTPDSVVTTQESSHRYLLLSSTSSVKRFRLYAGEQITFQLADGKIRYSGVIQGIRKNSFYFQNTEIPLAKVTSIKLRNHTGLRKTSNFLGYALQSAGSLFVLVGAVNVVTNLKDKEDRKEGFITMGASAVGFGVGYGFRKLASHTFKIGDKWQLKVVEMY